MSYYYPLTYSDIKYDYEQIPILYKDGVAGRTFDYICVSHDGKYVVCISSSGNIDSTLRIFKINEDDCIEIDTFDKPSNIMNICLFTNDDKYLYVFGYYENITYSIQNDVFTKINSLMRQPYVFSDCDIGRISTSYEAIELSMTNSQLISFYSSDLTTGGNARRPNVGIKTSTAKFIPNEPYALLCMGQHPELFRRIQYANNGTVIDLGVKINTIKNFPSYPRNLKFDSTGNYFVFSAINTSILCQYQNGVITQLKDFSVNASIPNSLCDITQNAEMIVFGRSSQKYPDCYKIINNEYVKMKFKPNGASTNHALFTNNGKYVVCTASNANFPLCIYKSTN